MSENRADGGPTHHGSGNTSPRMPRRASSWPSLGNFTSHTNGTPPPPTMLGVTTPSNMTKNVLDANGGGSLRSDSELDMSGGPAGDEVLESDTRQLIANFLGEFTGLSKPRWKRDKALSTMKRVVEDVLDKHRYAYNGMIHKLGLDDRGDDLSFVSSVAKSLFSDGTSNWGRIATLVAFGAVVCQHQKERGMDHRVELVGQEISSYLLSDQRDWLVKANSWGGFVDFFQVADPESTVRNTLMAFVGLAGIGAALTLLSR
ncbi:induced myeloid leukemia cell differentiation protein Mcl-1-like [Lampris incognitus]|uniref:induced myeloid leukemia cell differentiation protein Mcl-1-like n=1 Tax=Lampris incognitus TaxID=2546036 RepID=UPI0024B49F78|nr:induced myeloid leukemia cell differentiation protein Mcl-1-like [Lampris incognitus]